MVLAFRPGVLVQIPSESYVSAMHLFICFFVMDFVHKILDWSKLKAVADNKINVTENLKFV